MAIAGSGGWIPSTGVYVRNRRLHVAEIAQNKPRSIVWRDMHEAAAMMDDRRGVILQIDHRGGNVIQLRQLLRQYDIID